MRGSAARVERLITCGARHARRNPARRRASHEDRLFNLAPDRIAKCIDALVIIRSRPGLSCSGRTVRGGARTDSRADGERAA